MARKKDGKPRGIVGTPFVPMTMSGFCQFPTKTSHAYCKRTGCTCPCHEEEK